MRPFRSSSSAMSPRMLGRLPVADGLAEHLAAHFAKRGVDGFQRIGRVFDVGPVQIEQHVVAVGCIAHLGGRQASLQAEHWQLFVAQGKQNALVQDEGDRHAAGVAFLVEQKVGMQVDASAFLDVVTRADFQVRHIVGVGQGEAEMRAHIGPLGLGGAQQVDPDGRESVEVFPAFDHHLPELAVDPFERLNLAVAKGGFPAADQLLPARIRHFPEDFVFAARRHLRPQIRGIGQGQCLKDRAELGGAEGGHQLVQFSQMLSVHQRFHDVLARHVLPLHHALDAPLLLQDVRNPVQQPRQVGRWVQSGVHGVDRAGRRKGGWASGRRSPWAKRRPLGSRGIVRRAAQADGLARLISADCRETSNRRALPA
jgi:hypothetical protein